MLTENISKGSKHPDLLHDCVGTDADVLPTEVLGATEVFTNAQRESVFRACQDLNKHYAVVRTTHETDFSGMVDTMPTQVCEVGEVSRVVGEVQQSLNQRLSFLQKYAGAEGGSFDIENCGITIAPFVLGDIQIETEHPNQVGNILYDKLIRERSIITDEWICRASIRPTHNRVGGGLLDRSSISPDFALQTESVYDSVNKKNWLLQVRAFAKKEQADFVLEDYDDLLSQYSLHNFGILPPEGVVLPLSLRSRKYYTDVVRRQSVEKGMSMGSKIPGYVLCCDNFHWPISKENYPQNIKGYIPRSRKGNYNLVHENTRFVQASLRNGGFASLRRSIEVKKGNTYFRPMVDHFFNDLSNSQVARFFADGYRMKVEPLLDHGKFELFLRDADMSWEDFLGEISEG